MSARSRAPNNLLTEFPINPHENRFSAASRTNPMENLRSRSYHGKCACDICTCGKHQCPPSVSPNRYPKNMRSTSQDDFRAYEPKEVKKANQPLETTKKPLHVGEPGRIMPDKPEKGQFQTSNQKSYPNHWQKDIDPQQLRFPSSRSAHQQSSEIFPKEIASDNKSPKPRSQTDRSLGSRGVDTTLPAGVSSRGRTGTSPTPRRANDTSPDFPLNQPSWTQSHPHLHSSPHYDTKGPRSTRHEYDLEEDPAADLSKTRVKPVKYDSRKIPDEALRSLESPNQTVKNVYDRASREEPPALPPRDDNDQYDSNQLLQSFAKDRYGPRRGIPRPQTNQKQLVPQRVVGDSPPKQHAEVASRRSNDRSRRAFESQMDNRPLKGAAYQGEEYQENRTPNRYASKTDQQDQNDRFTSRKSDYVNPVDREPQSFRTPVKDRDTLNSSRPRFTDESVIKSPNQTTTPNRVIRGDNLAVDRSLPLDGTTTYNQDYKFEPPKVRIRTGQAEQKPATSTTIRDTDDRAYGKIKSIKYDAVRTAYQDEFKDIPPSYFLQKDCPMQGLPKPPKIITAGKLHVYYDEQENDWN